MWVKEMKMQEEKNLLLHFCPAWRLEILQRLGMVMAIAGFIPTSLAMGERNTAQIQAVIVRNFFTWVQHAEGMLAWAFLVAPRHGIRLRATVLRGFFPQY